MKGGEYDTRLTWLRATAGEPDTFGQKPIDTPPLGYLWAAVDDIAANREVRKESERQVTTATIRIRNYPDVLPGDYLRSEAWAQTWKVLTAIAGDNEIICEVEQ